MTEKQYEKITVNLPAVDLGKIDYLVEQGFYNTRTEFIRTSIKNEIDKNAYAIDTVIQEEGKKKGSFFVIGVINIDRKTLTKYLKQNKKVSIFAIGMCFISKDVDVNLASKTINSFKVYGIKKGPKDVMEYLTKMK
ncbi:MAG: CopG family transcriptional regulator [Candidatus Heimdallarchaeota archaeon]|nr:CopG family transcriptional regulator [Candidatus Heimdallarchaeota archaeon]MCK4770055.1 CopG family transcriptional regulator [Candidatus Heimdallarchaeota archaeon]